MITYLLQVAIIPHNAKEASAGKIKELLLGIIHVALLKTLQYISSQILQTR